MNNKSKKFNCIDKNMLKFLYKVSKRYYACFSRSSSEEAEISLITAPILQFPVKFAPGSIDSFPVSISPFIVADA